MLCHLCKNNQATLQVNRVINGQVLTLNLCADCYANLPAALQSLSFEQHSPCPDCSTTFETIKATGKFGCPTCYTHFAHQCSPLLCRIHDGAVHKGKTPQSPKSSNNTDQSKLSNLKQTLQKLIANQEFEQAALVRDQIKSLQGDHHE